MSTFLDRLSIRYFLYKYKNIVLKQTTPVNVVVVVFSNAANRDKVDK